MAGEIPLVVVLELYGLSDGAGGYGKIIDADSPAAGFGFRLRVIIVVVVAPGMLHEALLELPAFHA